MREAPDGLLDDVAPQLEGADEDGVERRVGLGEVDEDVPEAPDAAVEVLDEDALVVAAVALPQVRVVAAREERELAVGEAPAAEAELVVERRAGDGDDGREAVEVEREVVVAVRLVEEEPAWKSKYSRYVQHSQNESTFVELSSKRRDLEQRGTVV